jgi:hypothetical protein
MEKYNVWTELQNSSTEMCQRVQRNLTCDYGICMFNVRTGGNVGMVVRTACTLGFSDVVICGRRHYDKRFTVGADKYINITHWEDPVHVDIKTVSPGKYLETIEYNPESFVEHCKQGNWTPVFIEQGGEDIREPTWKHIERPLLVFGNESIGIPKNFMKKVSGSRVLSIPQWSVLRSMNIANAASIAMWELKRKDYTLC